jgi:small subunit ribosomal protein S17
MKKTETTSQVNKKTLQGVVVSDKMQKTLVVTVERYVKHPKYGKYFTISKKYKAHYEGDDIKVGDKVTIVECRPRSKDKHFEVTR